MRGIRCTAAYRRHCERSEAIHITTRGQMDCFAALSMTVIATEHEIVVPREGGVSSTPRLIDSITTASGILGHPPQCAIAHKAGDDN